MFENQIKNWSSMSAVVIMLKIVVVKLFKIHDTVKC